MKDLLFSGKDVEEAVAAASQVLGMARGGLRYVVLAKGSPGRFGGAAVPAQIAVLLDQAVRAGSQEAPPAAAAEPSTAENLLRLLKDVAGLDLELTVREGDGGHQVAISGLDTTFLLQGDAAVLQALEHLLQRVEQQRRGRLSLACEGYREWRDDALRTRALALAADVLIDGQDRATGPLNSYERRIVHLAIESVAGVTTRSVGEGGDRRVILTTTGTAAGETEHAAE